MSDPMGLLSDGLTREQWLKRAAQTIQRWIADRLGKPQPEVYVSVGFTGIGSPCQLDRVLGACWALDSKANGKPHLFISPIVAGEPWEDQGVLHVLTHELCHVAAQDQSHGAKFQHVARAIGLLPPWRTTKLSAKLQHELEALALTLGPWEHEPLKVDTRPRKRAALLAGNELGREARIVIPSEDKHGNPLPDHFVADLLLEIAKLFGGFSAWGGESGYIMADGKLKTERVCIVDIAAGRSSRAKLEQLAKDIHEQGKQETVYLRLPSGRVELV